MRPLPLLLATVTAAAAPAAALAAPASPPRLVGTVGPGFTITLTAGGRPVARLKPGRYTIVVFDRSPIHDFHLTGPGIDKATGVASVGTTTWTVRLRRGRYHFQCDPHRTIMNGDFSVG
jgi:hypothetical protein